MANRNLTRAVRVALLTASAASAAMYAGVGNTQQLEEIVVTGSRIATTAIDSVSPVQIIGAADIQDAGVANIQGVLLQSPVMGTPGWSRTNSNFNVANNGVASIDLRNLGTARTLVLVDGRRFVAGIPGTSAVDMNAIPTQFIERIDVLTGGASAVYGSDAVAGVVNIILKKHFEGVEFAGQSGVSKESDNREDQMSLTFGANTADGKGNVMAHIGWTKQGEVYSRNRPRSAVDQLSQIYFTGDWADVFKAHRPFYSSYAPQGHVWAGSDDYTWDANGNVIPWSTNGTSTLAATGFNRDNYRYIALPVERYLLATRASYEIADNHSVFMEGTYAATHTQSHIEPFPLSSYDLFPGSDGWVPIETMYDGQMRVNPLIPSYVVNSAVDETGDGRRDYYFTRRLIEVGDRANTGDRGTFRVVAGFEGTVFDDWSYDAYYSYGQTSVAQISRGQVNVSNFRYALQAVPDVTDVNNNGDTTEAICADAQARAEGCVPISIMGYGAISPAAAAYVRAPSMLKALVTQKNAGLNLSGELVDLWAGPLSVAVGGEWRKEFSSNEFDALTALGLNAGNATPPTKGSFDVSEGYIEANLPLLKDVPLAQKLNARAAFRYADYSTVGGVNSWNAGFEWSPISQVRFRVIRAQSTRAPNITELYAPQLQDFPTGLSDPCVGVTATSSGTLDDLCRSQPGVNTNIAQNGSFVQTQGDIQGISAYSGGNPDLKQEVGKSWTIGAVITPEGVPFLQDFAFTIDYFDIQIDHAIVTTPYQFILDQCYNGDSSFCADIQRRANAAGAYSAGSIQYLFRGASNSGGAATKGVDFTASYSHEIGPGQFSGRLSYTHVIDGYTIPLPGSAKDPFAGEIGASKDRALLSLGYRWNDFNFTWRTSYIGKACLDNTFTSPDPSSVACIGAYVYNDVQARWMPGDRYELYVGVDNLFNQDPPPILSGLPGDVTGTETDSGTYDAIGQRYYAGVRVKF